MEVKLPGFLHLFNFHRMKRMSGLGRTSENNNPTPSLFPQGGAEAGLTMLGEVGGGPAFCLVGGTHLSMSPTPRREKGRRSLEGQKLRAWLWAGLGLLNSKASVVFHNQQASSPGHVLPSPLALHIPLHIQAAKQHSGLCWGLGKKGE